MKIYHRFLFASLLLLGASYSMSFTEDDADGLPRECQDLNKYLASYPDDCRGAALAMYPGFSEWPWQELNPQENFETLVNLETFDLQSKSGAVSRRAQIQSELETNSIQIAIWKGKIFGYFDHNRRHPDTEPIQTLYRISHRTGSNAQDECVKNFRSEWHDAVFVVNGDAPDNRLDPYITTALQIHSLRRSGETPILVGTDGVFPLLNATVLLNYVCNFKNQ